MKCWFEGLLQLCKGEILEIKRAYQTSYEGYDLRVTVIDVLTTGIHYTRQFDGQIIGPILGRVIRSDVRGGTHTTFFEIEEGHFEDYVFVKAGEVKKGLDALKEIFTRRIDEYVKIWDPYISADNIRLVSIVEGSKTILILTEKIDDLKKIEEAAKGLPNRIIIKKVAAKIYHDRFILTRGEGWIVGHSLKDLGKRNSMLNKLASSVEAEMAFDENWIPSETVFEKN